LSTAATGWIWEDSRVPVVIGVLGAFLAVSLFYTPIPLVLFLGIPALFYYISRPYELLLVMVFLIPFNFVFKIGPIPVAAELLKVVAWIPFLIHLSTRSQAFKSSTYNWCYGVLAGLLLLSLFRSKDLPFTVKESVRLASNIGLCYLTLNLVDSREKVFQIFRVLAFSTFLVACYGFYQFVIQDFGALFWIVNPRLDTSLAHGRTAFWEWRNRITSVLTSEMELGHYFNLCLPIGAVLWLTDRRKRAGSKWLLMTLAMLGGLLLTFTFGAWLSLAATSGFFILFLAKKRKWSMLLAAALVLLLVVAVLGSGPFRPFLEEKISGTGVGGLAWDWATRFQSWTLAAIAIRAHPVIGIGYGNFPNMTLGILQFLTQEWVESGSSPHEAYLYISAELGIVGLVAVLFVLVSTVRTNLKLRADPWLGPATLALAFGLTTAMLGGFSDDSPFFGPHGSYLVWFFVGLSEAIRNLAVSYTPDRGASSQMRSDTC
jgi:O-antigen ligase